MEEAGAEKYKGQFREALDNDLNTSLAVTALYDVLKAELSDATKRALIASFDQVLGLELLERAAALQEKENAPVEGSEEIEALIAQRSQAKAGKNWAEADRIRDELKARGIELVDTKEGTTWKKI